MAALASFVAKGTYGGYDTDFLKVLVEIYATAPGERTMIAHTPIGDSTTTFDGRAGWIAARDRSITGARVSRTPALAIATSDAGAIIRRSSGTGFDFGGAL